MHKILIKHQNELNFEARINNHTIEINPDFSPKPLLLVALGGCTAMDCAALARKMRLSIEDFEVEVEAKLSKDKPHIYTIFRVIYCFKTENTPTKQTLEKIHKIVEMSQERYCTVANMLRKIAPVCYCITVNNERIERCICREF